MIAFLQPLALFGLLAAAIPAVLHLIERRMPPAVPFPAVRYLTETERRHSRRLKLRNLLLLILRTLLIVVLVLAAARPVAQVPVGGAHEPTAVALIVDNSLSSGAVVGGRPVLEELKDRARRILGRITEVDRLWLVLGDGLPRRVSGPEADRLLSDLAPSPARLDLGDAVRTAARVVAGAGLGQQTVVVLSDLQASAVTAGSLPAVRVLVGDPPPPPENRGIDSARAEPRVWTPEGSVITAIGGTASSPAEVRLAIGAGQPARGLAAPGAVLSLGPMRPEPGWHVATIQIDADELRADDEWRLAIRAAPPAAARAGAGAGTFVGEGVGVLVAAGRARTGDAVVLDDRPGPGLTILFPPADAALVGTVNRSLAARRAGWRFGDRVSGEWMVEGPLEALAGTPVMRRHRLVREGTVETAVVLATAAGEPWIVRDGHVIVVGSRLDEGWTTLPMSASFVPFLDLLINRVAAQETWIVAAAPGEPVELPPPADAVLDATGPMAVSEDGRIVAPLVAGVYFLRGAAGDTVGALEVNHDGRESRLARATAAALAAAFGPQARPRDMDDLERDLFESSGRADVSSLLLGLAMLVALVELAVATAGGRAHAT